jgi:hypothetical protein
MISTQSPNPKINLTKEKILLAAGLGLCVTGLMIFFVRLKYVSVSSNDLLQDITAAKAFLEKKSIYASGTNGHPPTVALLFIPLSFLPYDTAAKIWSLLEFVLYFIGGLIVIKEYQIHLSWGWTAILCGFALWWYPFQVNIGLGQLSILLSFLIIGAWRLLRHNQDIAAGTLLGLACLIKIFPVLFILYLIIKKRWKAVWAVLTVVAAGLLVTTCILGLKDVLTFFTQVIRNNSEIWSVFPINLSITGVFGRFLSDGAWVEPIIVAPRIANMLSLLIDIGLVILLIVQIWKMKPGLRGDDRAYSLTIIAILLVSPMTWEHSLVMLTLPLGFLVSTLQLLPNPRLRHLSLLALVLFSLPDVQVGNAIMNFYAPAKMPWFSSLILLLPTIGMFVIWGLFSACWRAIDSAVINPDQ